MSAQWPQEDDDILRETWPHHSARTIAKHFLQDRYSRNAVVGRAHRMKLMCKKVIAQNPYEPVPAKRKKPERVMKEEPATPEPETIGIPGEFGDGCKWPRGEVIPVFQECGQPRAHGKVYCQYHHAKSVDRSRQTKTADEVNNSHKLLSGRVFR